MENCRYLCRTLVTRVCRGLVHGLATNGVYEALEIYDQVAQVEGCVDPLHFVLAVAARLLTLAVQQTGHYRSQFWT